MPAGRLGTSLKTERAWSAIWPGTAWQSPGSASGQGPVAAGARGRSSTGQQCLPYEGAENGKGGTDMRRDDVRYAVAAREDGLRRVRKFTVTIGSAATACCAVLFAAFGHAATAGSSSSAASSSGSGSRTSGSAGGTSSGASQGSRSQRNGASQGSRSQRNGASQGSGSQSSGASQGSASQGSGGSLQAPTQAPPQSASGGS